MELDITAFFTGAAASDYSASQAELGPDAGRITWNHAKEDSPDYMILDTEEKREAMRRYVRGFGAWDESEIASWSDEELNALLLQDISGNIREAGLDQAAPDWEEYQEGAEAGRYSGRLFEGTGGRIYFYIGE